MHQSVQIIIEFCAMGLGVGSVLTSSPDTVYNLASWRVNQLFQVQQAERHLLSQQAETTVVISRLSEEDCAAVWVNEGYHIQEGEACSAFETMHPAVRLLGRLGNSTDIQWRKVSVNCRSNIQKRTGNHLRA